MRTAKPRNDTSGNEGSASRFVRLETGSSRDAEFASRAQACTIGRGLTRLAVAAAATTGVSSTTVASRLSVAVVTAAAAKVSSSIRRGLPRPSASDERADRREHALGGAHLRDHEDRGQEGDDRQQQPYLVDGAVDVHGTDQEHRAGGHETDQHLDPAGRVHERHRQQHPEGDDGDDVDHDRRHRRTVSPARVPVFAGCEDGRVSEQAGRYQRSAGGMVGAMVVLVVLLVAWVALQRGSPSGAMAQAFGPEIGPPITKNPL